MGQRGARPQESAEGPGCPRNEPLFRGMPSVLERTADG